jgi:hypothetical protein
MKTPQVSFEPESFSEIYAVSARYTTTGIVRADLSAAIREAERVAGLTLEVLLETTRPASTAGKRASWDSNSAILTYLGRSPLLASEIELTVYRMATVYRRLQENELHIRLLPQHRASKDTVSGHNLGGSFSPNTFVLYPYWFHGRDPYTIVHELFHEWYDDFKVGPRGDRRKAYGAADARQLAQQHPGRARRNAENHEQLCREVNRLLRAKRIPKLPTPISKGISKGVNRSVVPNRVVKGVTRGVRNIIGKAPAGATAPPQPRTTTTTGGRPRRTGVPKS